MKRRDILKNIGLGTVGVAVTGNATFGQTTKKPTKTSSPVEAKKAVIGDVEGGFLREEIERNQRLMAEKFFNDHEKKTITVLADIIIPADEKSGSASQAGVPAFIEFIVKDMPHYKTPMRGGLMWLDNEAKKQFGGTFSEISSANQLKLVEQIAYPSIAKPEHSQGVAFFNLMRNLTATGFFTSEMGVKDLGYVGNQPNVWDGVPQEVLDKYHLSYSDWEKHLEK